MRVLKQLHESVLVAAAVISVGIASVAHGELTADGGMVSEGDIQRVVDMETEAWNSKDAGTLVSLFHPDMVWPWPPNAHSHDPATWEFPQGRFNRERWTRIYEGFFASHELVHNIRETVRITISEEGDGAFAVVDVDTLWRNTEDGSEFHWKGRAGKGYTLVDGEWLLIFHTGLLSYED